MERGHDVIIVGAGPAGTSAALRAAELGLATVVLEKQVFPRPKPCAAGLTARALRWLGPEVEAVIHDRVETVDLLLAPDLKIAWAGGGVVLATTSRRELDSLLARRAEEAGARIEFGNQVESIVADDEGVAVRAAGGIHRARYLIAADGIEGPIRRAFGMPRLAVTGAIYVHAFPPSPDDLTPHRGRAVFDFTRRRRGYGWLFPKRDHLNVGIYGRASGKGSSRDELTSLLESLDLATWRIEGPFASLSPCRTSMRDLARGPCLFAGDAGGLANPITGEGISHALASGRIAAESVAATFRKGGAISDRYARRVVSEVLPDVNVLRGIGGAFYALGPRGIGFVARRPALRNVLIRRRTWEEFRRKGGRIVVG